MAEYSFSASYISFFPTKKIRFRERFKHEVFPRLSRNELFIYSLFFLNVNISIIANTDAPIARIGMNRFVSSPVAGAESERGTLSSTIDVFFDALLFLAADADESGVLSSEMVVVPLCESVSLSLIPAVFVVGVGVVAGSIDSSGVTDGDAVTVSAVGVAVAASAVGVAVGASVTVAGVFVTVGVAVVFAVGVAVGPSGVAVAATVGVGVTALHILVAVGVAALALDAGVAVAPASFGVAVGVPAGTTAGVANGVPVGHNRWCHRMVHYLA